MLSNILLKSLWDFRKAAIYWFIAIFSLATYIMFVVSSIELDAFQEITASMPKALTQFLGGTSGLDFGSIEGFLNAQVFTIMAPIMAIAVAVNYGGKATAQEESSKSLDIILSAPISRESFIIQKIFSMIIKTLFIAITHWVSYFILGIIFSQNIPIEGLSAICFNLFLMGITFGMISVFIGTLSGNSTQAISIGGALALIAYLVANIAPLVDSLSNTKYFALFYYYKGGEPLKNGFHSWHWIPFLAITLTFIFLSIYQFKKRNLL
jgi:ABC-2 type transport system permease protein|tara:strand:- start:520 stop:1317 length:798 start_codon:yes stop_codon:yes gene_type:complete